MRNNKWNQFLGFALTIALLSTCVFCFASAETVAPVGEPITLKLGHSASEQDVRALGSNMFKKLVEERSGGAITVEIYPGGQLGGETAMIESITLNDGTVDITMADTIIFSQFEKMVGISALPFLFADYDEAWAFMASDIESDVEALLLNQNIRVIGHFDNGFRCVTTGNKAINTPEDMKDLLIRTPESQEIMATMRSLGANPQPLAFNELYLALQQKTYDAEENPIPLIYNNKFYEVQGYLSITNHVYGGQLFVINDSVWQKLSPEQQAVVQGAINEAGEYNRNLNRQMSEDCIALLEEKGMTVIRPELAPFVEASKSAYEELTKNYSEEWLARLDAWKAEH